MKGIEAKLFMFLAHKLDEIKPPIWTPGVVESPIEIFSNLKRNPQFSPPISFIKNKWISREKSTIHKVKNRQSHPTQHPTPRGGSLFHVQAPGVFYFNYEFYLLTTIKASSNIFILQKPYYY